MSEHPPGLENGRAHGPVATVTKIEPLRGALGACRVYVDDELLGTLPADVLSELDLVFPRPITADESGRLIREAEIFAAVRKALHLLAYRPRTQREIEIRLRKSGHEDEAIRAAVTRCARLGYLDDAAFARAYVGDRLRLKPRGSRALVSELIQKGVERGIAAEAVAAGFVEAGVSESDLALRLAETRMRSLRGYDPETAGRRLSGYLGRRGFPAGVTRDAVARAVAEVSAGDASEPSD